MAADVAIFLVARSVSDTDALLFQLLCFWPSDLSRTQATFFVNTDNCFGQRNKDAVLDIHLSRTQTFLITEFVSDRDTTLT